MLSVVPNTPFLPTMGPLYALKKQSNVVVVDVPVAVVDVSVAVVTVVVVVLAVTVVAVIRITIRREQK